ncbi:MAG: hypothetical protein AB7P00_43300 [Sandaracinaceae bacterium]
MRRPYPLLVALACSPSACAVGGMTPPDAGTIDAGSDPTPDAGRALAEVPSTLSDTGLYAGAVGGAYAPDVLTYDVRYSLWVDGAAKRRHVLLPPGTAIDTSDPDGWVFPVGTRVFKEFFVDGRPVETRLLLKTGPSRDEWTYVSYVFRAVGSDADAEPMGATDVRGTTHDVPSQTECHECHQAAPDFVLGFSAIQISRAAFDLFVAEGALPSGTTFGEIPGTQVERDALGYLHANCGHCHREGHPVSEQRSLRLDLRVGLASVQQANAYATALDAPATDRVNGTRVWIAPGDPAMSQIVARMGERSMVGMPPLGTDAVDDYGVAAVSTWIATLPP